MPQNKIIIVGAGLCGSLLALRLAQRGFQVALYEKRADMRLAHVDAGRSINLALSARGLMALDRAGIKEDVLKNCIPMRGRLIHPLGSPSFLSPYSGRAEDYINSVSRSGLNIALLNAAEQQQYVTLNFGTKVTQVDLEHARISYLDAEGQQHTDEGQLVIGTDGAGSVVRKGLMQQTTRLRFNYTQHFLEHGYKELSILPTDGGGWQIEKEALHIWPRGHYMIIALPNLDGSFTLTMFHPYKGEAGFDTLNTAEKVSAFFEAQYPTLLPYIPHYLEEYFENPVGTLGTIKCAPWQAYHSTLIMGDAAHAIVPFYGQGMNASFEDVRVFDDLLEEHGTDWAKILPAFEDARLNNANAISELAIDNFYEMRDKVDDVPFMRKRKIEMQLEQQFPDYYSKYSLVTFRPDLPYAAAQKQGLEQDALLLQLCQQDNFQDIPLAEYHRQLQNLRAL